MGKIRQSEPDKEYYTWEQYQKDIMLLAEKIRELSERRFQNIYGIPRGGLIVAVSLSHALGIPIVLDRQDITPITLVVDDIADTGKTIDHICQQLTHRPFIATLYHHPQSTIMPDLYIRTKGHWIVFPWETNTSSLYDGTAL